MIIYNKYTTSVDMSDQELHPKGLTDRFDPVTSDSPTKSDDQPKIDIKDMVKEDVDDINIEPEEKEKLDKLMSYIHSLPLDKKNQLLANLAKNREVNPNGNVYYPSSKRDILKFKLHQLQAQKRNQRLGKHVIDHKMEMAEAYRKNKEKAKDDKDEPNDTDNGVSVDGDNKDSE